MLRLALCVGLLLLTIVGPFLLWADTIESLLVADGLTDWMRQFGPWAWLPGIGLVIADIALPVPSTAIMSAIGIIYGPLLGGVINATGSVLAGTLGYAVCRAIGPRRAEFLAGQKGFDHARRFFDRYGGWAVAGSRWLPVLPEAVSFLAGLTAMPARRYFIALACGSVPLGFVFAYAGYAGSDRPLLTLIASAVLPLVLWAPVRLFLNRL